MTPTSYLELIGLFTDLVGKKPTTQRWEVAIPGSVESELRRGELTTKLERYTIGSKTLNETKSVVDDLKVGSGNETCRRGRGPCSQDSLAKMQPVQLGSRSWNLRDTSTAETSEH